MGLYLRQLLAGRDFAAADRIAAQMANFVYLIGDDETRDCLVVDPAWDVIGILNAIDRKDLNLVGALVTHYHPDHVGGNIYGHSIAGLAELQSLRPVKCYVNSQEKEGVKMVTGLSDSDIIEVDGGDEFRVGNTQVRFIHTPGHTPGSQCFLSGDSLVSGDTLFVRGCGRVDLPGGDPEQMYYSLTQVLGKLPDSTMVYPGHNYAAEASNTIAQQKRENPYMRIGSLEEWQRLMA